MFVWNEELRKLFVRNHPHYQVQFIDFGQVPEDLLDREDWNAEVMRLTRALVNRRYQCNVAMYDGASGLCPLYTVKMVPRYPDASTAVDLVEVERVVQSLCFPGQQTEIREQVLGIQVLPDLALS